MAITGYEIDFLPVGEKSSSGDAILFRYKEDDQFKVILIDGGHKISGNVKTSDTILEHLRKFYFPDAKEDNKMHIEHIVCSHPDSDHVGGLQEIMEQCSVGTFWINNPLDYTNKSKLADSANHNAFSKADAETVENLIEVAETQGIAVYAPLQGKNIGPLSVASPSEEFYETLVKGGLKRQGGLLARVKSKISELINLIDADWDKDALYDFPATSVCNESSTVLFGSLVVDKNKFLLTADAGIEALSEVYSYLEENLNFRSGTLNFIQMPHHGGRHNVNNATLNQLLGSKLSRNSHEISGNTFACVAKEASDYPRKSIINAFMTRGYHYPFNENEEPQRHESMRHVIGDMPKREGWGPLSNRAPFFDKVESL